MDFKQLVASKTSLPPAEAADCVDQLVSGILRRLRNGTPVPLPGVGVLCTDKKDRVKLRPLPKKTKGVR